MTEAPKKEAPKAPATSAEQRASEFRWLRTKWMGCGGPLENAIKKPDVTYEEADELVRMLQSVADTARVARDSLPRTDGTQIDQVRWLNSAIKEGIEEMRSTVRIVKTEIGNTARDVAAGVVAHLKEREQKR